MRGSGSTERPSRWDPSSATCNKTALLTPVGLSRNSPEGHLGDGDATRGNVLALVDRKGTDHRASERVFEGIGGKGITATICREDVG